MPTKNALNLYNLPEHVYWQIWETQNGQCAICGKALEDSSRSTRHDNTAVIDHDHRTGLVRGLLCHACNTGIGKFADSSVRLRMAARYLDDSREVSPTGQAVSTTPLRRVV